ERRLGACEPLEQALRPADGVVVVHGSVPRVRAHPGGSVTLQEKTERTDIHRGSGGRRAAYAAIAHLVPVPFSPTVPRDAGKGTPPTFFMSEGDLTAAGGGPRWACGGRSRRG